MQLRAISTALVLALLCTLLLSGCGRSTPAHWTPEGSITASLLADRSAASERLFEKLSVETSGIDFQIRWDKPAKFNRIFFSQNSGGGVCIGDYDNDGKPDLYFTSPSGGNRLFQNLNGHRFHDVTEQAGIADDKHWGTGASFVDLDNDGDLDLVACGYKSTNKCLINQGDGTFRDEAAERGLDFKGASVMMSWADYDRDGDLDAYLVTAGLPPGPRENFAVRFEGDKPVIPDHLVEYWKLIYLPGDRAKQVEAGQYDKLYENQGNGHFKEMTSQAGITGTDIGQSATWWDYDKDGWPDLYVANDYWGEDYLWHNEGNGRFTNVNTNALPHTPWSSMGADFGDINNDGWLDFMGTDMSMRSHFRQKTTMGDMSDSGWFLEYAQPRQYMRNACYLNTGTERFMEVAQLLGIESTDWTWSNRFEDFDNDGRLDLFVANGVMRDFMDTDLNQTITNRFREGSSEFFAEWMKQAPRKDHNLAFRNAGGLNFESIGEEWGLDLLGVSFGAATGDLDGDGDMDLVVNNADQPAAVFRNGAQRGHRVIIELEGTRSNRDGFGTRLEIETKAGRQTRYTSNARGWMSASENLVHIGLGSEDRIERLTLFWPSGHVQSFTELEANKHYLITEPYEKPPLPPGKIESDTWFEAIPGLANIRHVEQTYDDFADQPLLPYKLSQRGPGLAVGDIEGDGDDDAYLPASAGFPGSLLRNKGGQFSVQMPESFKADAAHEDQAALLFDANGDEALDLYVVSGSSEFPPEDERLRDRLYLNQTGQLIRVESALPDLRLNGSAVAAVDMDRDGDLDLFVGSHAVPGRYPETQNSHLLRNNRGVFSAEPIAAGIVNSAIWSDVDDDGWIDLLLATEWGPVRLFKNNDGTLAETTDEAGLSQAKGWWNSLNTSDLDGDGDIDFVAGNLGLNTKYHAPVRLYYGDFDGSGERRIVEAGFKGEDLLPVRGKSCSQNAMPWIRTQFPTYHSFASATLTDIFPASKLEASIELEANTLESGAWLNDGKGHFSFHPLPRLAQAAPIFGLEFSFVNKDRIPDLYVVQNAWHPQRETGRFDGGVSLLLLGKGDGGFEPVPAHESGLVVAGDATALARVHLGQGARALLVAQNNGALLAYRQKKSGLKLRSFMHAEPGCRIHAEYRDGASVTFETRAGGGYLSQSSTIYPLPQGYTHLHVRRVNGVTSEETAQP